MYWNDDTLHVEAYSSNKKVYYCGKELLKFSSNRSIIYTILVLDYDDCCCANVWSDGEIQILFKEHSSVPHKMKVGGQSAKRFSNIRQNEITKWFKRIDDYLKRVNQEIYLGVNHVYEKRFMKTLSTYNKQKIKQINSTEYADLSGIYQYINKLENR